jgi:hypothetical protein
MTEERRRHPNGRFLPSIPVGTSQAQPRTPTPMVPRRDYPSGKPEQQGSRGVTPQARQSRRSG